MSRPILRQMLRYKIFLLPLYLCIPQAHHLLGPRGLITLFYISFFSHRLVHPERSEEDKVKINRYGNIVCIRLSI